MEKSIVIFGPGHVGKSTLAGYLLYKLTPGFDLDKFKTQVQKSVGEYYDESQLFAYIVDASPRERMDAERKAGGQEGTSKYLHIDRVNIEEHDLTILDTPGAQHHYKERIRGWYYGNIGVFMIELSKLVKHKQLMFSDLKKIQDYLTTLHLWLEFKDDRDILILLSKMDFKYL